MIILCVLMLTDRPIQWPTPITYLKGVWFCVRYITEEYIITVDHATS